MVVLALLREQRPDIPVIYFPAFTHPTKHAFAQRVIRDWNLRMWDWHPCQREVIGKGQHVELVEAYQVSAGASLDYVTLPIEAEPGYKPDRNCICAIEQINRPTGEEVYLLDTLFIGHRGDDIDPTHGAVPLKNWQADCNGISVVYPLKDWTEADIWAASALLDIPQNEARYLRGEMEYNPDYWPLCTNCLQPGQDGEMVHCPKVDGKVYNLGKYLNLEERRLAWRRQFVNVISPEES